MDLKELQSLLHDLNHLYARKDPNVGSHRKWLIDELYNFNLYVAFSHDLNEYVIVDNKEQEEIKDKEE